MNADSLSEFFELSEFNATGAASPEDIFSILEAMDGVSESIPVEKQKLEENILDSMEGVEINGERVLQKAENEVHESLPPKSKRQKLSAAMGSSEEVSPDGQQKMAHITVERNRRKQMNEHLSILRSLMPCFYVKRGDQASIIGGVVSYISEMQQILQSLEAKKQRKVYSEVLSPRIISSSPRSSPLSPSKPPLSPRLSLPISPRTPPSTTTSPYKPRLHPTGYAPQSLASPLDPSPPSSTATSSLDSVNELVANSKSAIAQVEVKFSGANVLLQTVSPKIQGQTLKIISALESLSFEILQVNISTFDEMMLTSFIIKIGMECELSADELACLIQQTFCS